MWKTADDRRKARSSNLRLKKVERSHCIDVKRRHCIGFRLSTFCRLSSKIREGKAESRPLKLELRLYKVMDRETFLHFPVQHNKHYTFYNRTWRSFQNRTVHFIWKWWHRSFSASIVNFPRGSSKITRYSVGVKSFSVALACRFVFRSIFEIPSAFGNFRLFNLTAIVDCTKCLLNN